MSGATEENGNGKRPSSIGVWLSGGGVIMAIIGAFIWVGGLASEVGQNQTTISAISTRLSSAEANNRALELRVTSLETSQKEIETQFCGTGNIINLMHANDMRLQSVLWQKSFPGITFPTDNPFYPVLCNRDGANGKM